VEEEEERRRGETPQAKKRRALTRTDVFLRLMLYALLQALFIRLGFGVAFFAVAALYGMFATASEHQRHKGELSAYSVFNKDCRSIEGSLSPEDFEREMRWVVATDGRQSEQCPAGVLARGA
jgi:hypothetical protein